MLGTSQTCKTKTAITGNSIYRMILTILLVIFLASPSGAQWRDELKSINIGIVGDRKPAITRRYIEPFRQALEDDLQITVKAVISKNFSSMINAQINGRIDYGIYSASAFANLWAKCKCAEPVAAANPAGGARQFFSILIVDQARINSLEEFAGKRVTYSTEKSLTGYIVPTRELQKQGLVFSKKPEAANDVGLVAAGSAEKAVDLFLDGEVDGLFGWSTMSGQASNGYSAGTLVDLIQKSGRNIAEFAILWKSGPIPGSPHVVSNKLPDQAKEKIEQFLLQLNRKNPAAYDAVENFSDGGFYKVSQADYQYLIDLASESRRPADKAGQSTSNDG